MEVQHCLPCWICVRPRLGVRQCVAVDKDVASHVVLCCKGALNHCRNQDKARKGKARDKGREDSNGASQK